MLETRLRRTNGASIANRRGRVLVPSRLKYDGRHAGERAMRTLTDDPAVFSRVALGGRCYAGSSCLRGREVHMLGLRRRRLSPLRGRRGGRLDGRLRKQSGLDVSMAIHRDAVWPRLL